jgi:hypothetical protein
VKISADLQKVTAELLQKHEEEEREKRRLLD